MKSIFIILCVTCVTRNVAAKIPLSSLTTVCDAKDPELNSCVAKAANHLMPVLAKGVRDYGFTPLDPLRVPRMDIGQEAGPVTLKLELIDTTHIGISSLRFRKAQIDMDKGHWVLNGTMEHYILHGRYLGKGRILLVPIIGDGQANFTLENTGMDFVLDGAPTKTKGKTYFKLNKLKVHMKFDKCFISLTNLFNGSKQLGETTNRFLNENSLEVFNNLKGTLEDVYSELYLGLLSRIFNSVPYDQIFKNV